MRYKMVYPNELAGIKRGEPMTWDGADHGKPNPHYGKGGGYRVNCQTCVVAFEARLRGFDVQALPYATGSQLQKLSYKTNLAWLDVNTGKHPDYIVGNNVETAKQCKVFLEQNVEKGSRYTFEFDWKKGGGHIVTVDKNADGSLRLYDPQDGKSYTGAQVDRYLGDLKYSAKSYGVTVPLPPKVLRVDDKGFDVDTVNKILEGANP